MGLAWIGFRVDVRYCRPGVHGDDLEATSESRLLGFRDERFGKLVGVGGRRVGETDEGGQVGRRDRREIAAEVVSVGLDELVVCDNLLCLLHGLFDQCVDCLRHTSAVFVVGGLDG